MAILPLNFKMMLERQGVGRLDERVFYPVVLNGYPSPILYFLPKDVHEPTQATH